MLGVKLMKPVLFREQALSLGRLFDQCQLLTILPPDAPFFSIQLILLVFCHVMGDPISPYLFLLCAEGHC